MILKRHLSPLFHTQNHYGIGVLHHLAFWALYFAFNVLRWGSYYDDFLLSLKGNLIGFPIHIILSYCTIYFLIPLFIKRRSFIAFIFALLATIFLMVRLKYDLTALLISTNVWPEGPEETTNFSLNYVITMMLGELYVVSFVTAIKITYDWMQEIKRAAKLEKLQLETELKFLRSQISPHFFFNTLNNIYSLSLDKSSKAPETILKLSDLMRYLLYETEESRQDLAKEIECLHNYLDLEKIRYGNTLKIDWNISGNSAGKKISPMLLIPFLENAFKHGANKNSGETRITIDIAIEDQFLYFRIANTLPPVNYTNPGESGGIGIANVKKRLELGYRKGEYQLKNFIAEGEYIVELNLKLK